MSQQPPTGPTPGPSDDDAPRTPDEGESFARSPYDAPDTPPATRPKVVSRELVVTRVIACGSTRGVTAALSTANDLLSTIAPSATG